MTRYHQVRLMGILDLLRQWPVVQQVLTELLRFGNLAPEAIDHA